MQLDPCFSNRLIIFVITTRSTLKVCLWKNRNAYISNLNARIVDSFWSDKMSRKDTREGQPLLFPEGTQSIFHRFFSLFIFSHSLSAFYMYPAISLYHTDTL